MPGGDGAGPAALFHVTHYKAGSQWIRAILERCFAERVVTPKPAVAHFLGASLREGAVYPTVYVTKEEFEAAPLPAEWSRFIVVRDLRDTLISLYFSLRYSHPTDRFAAVRSMRSALEPLGESDGLSLVMRRSLKRSAAIQRSWAASGEPLIRYEDLLGDDVAILERVLIGELGADVSPSRLEKAVRAARFERMSGGRARGEEVRDSHHRKATPGDWRGRLSDRQVAEFKELYGDVLIATGYERDLDW